MADLNRRPKDYEKTHIDFRIINQRVTDITFSVQLFVQALLFLGAMQNRSPINQASSQETNEDNETIANCYCDLVNKRVACSCLTR